MLVHLLHGLHKDTLQLSIAHWRQQLAWQLSELAVCRNVCESVGLVTTHTAHAHIRSGFGGRLTTAERSLREERVWSSVERICAICAFFSTTSVVARFENLSSHRQ